MLTVRELLRDLDVGVLAGEANLDIEWAYAMAPAAHIVLLGVPPAETEGVQGFPNLFKAMSDAIDRYPAGTIFSQSFGVTEETFGGAAQTQTAKFDAIYKKGNAKGDTFLASSGDDGSFGVSKQHRGRRHAAAGQLDLEPDVRHPVQRRRHAEPGLLRLDRRRRHRGGLERVLGRRGHRWRPVADLPAARVAERRRGAHPG